MNNKEKAILKHLVESEIKEIKNEERKVVFPPLDFLTSIELYEEMLKKILKKINV
jgi:hypothetical protein